MRLDITLTFKGDSIATDSDVIQDLERSLSAYKVLNPDSRLFKQSAYDFLSMASERLREAKQELIDRKS